MSRSFSDNPGKVDVERAADAIIANGGGRNVQHYSDHDHISVYSTTTNEHLSWDEYPDGTIKNVHTDKNNHGHYWYGN